MNISTKGSNEGFKPSRAATVASKLRLAPRFPSTVAGGEADGECYCCGSPVRKARRRGDRVCRDIVRRAGTDVVEMSGVAKGGLSVQC